MNRYILKALFTMPKICQRKSLLRLNGKQIYLAGGDFTLEANLSFSLDHKYSPSEG